MDHLLAKDVKDGFLILFLREYLIVFITGVQILCKFRDFLLFVLPYQYSSLIFIIPSHIDFVDLKHVLHFAGHVFKVVGELVAIARTLNAKLIL